MVDVNKMKEKIEELKEEIKKVNEHEESIDKKVKEQEEAKKQFAEKYQHILDGSSDNPFDIADKENEEKILIEKDNNLGEEKESLKTSKSELNENFNNFIDESKKEVKEEKDKIKENVNEDARKASIAKLEEEKAQYEKDKDMFENRVKGQEENNINPNDIILRRLKDETIPELQEKIENIDVQIEELQPENLREKYKKLESIDDVLSNVHTMEIKLDELSETLGIEEEEEFDIKDTQPIEIKPENIEPEPEKVEPKNAEPEKVEPQKPKTEKVEPANTVPQPEITRQPAPKQPIQSSTNPVVNRIPVNRAQVAPRPVTRVSATQVPNNQSQTSPEPVKENQVNPTQENARQSEFKIYIGKDGVELNYTYTDKDGITKMQKPVLPIKDNIFLMDVDEDCIAIINSTISGLLKERVTLDERSVTNMDPNIIMALTSAKRNTNITDAELKDITQTYLNYATRSNLNKETREKLKSMLTYDRKGIDYLKPSNIIKMIRNRKAYQNIRDYAELAEYRGIAEIKKDEPGKIRQFISKIKNKVKTFAKKEDTKLIEDKNTVAKVESSKDRRENFIKGMNKSSEKDNGSKKEENIPTYTPEIVPDSKENKHRSIADDVRQIYLDDNEPKGR